MSEQLKALEPMHGFAIVRVVEGQTPGGIVLPETADTKTLVLEKAASHYFIGGQEKPFNAQPGARVVLQPGSKVTVQDVLLPPGFGIIRLLDVSAYEVLSEGEA